MRGDVAVSRGAVPCGVPALEAELAGVVEDCGDAVEVGNLGLCLVLLRLVWVLWLCLRGRGLCWGLRGLGSSAAVFCVVVFHVAVAAPFATLRLALAIICLPFSLSVVLLVLVVGILVAFYSVVAVLVADIAVLVVASLSTALRLTAASSPVFPVTTACHC